MDLKKGYIKLIWLDCMCSDRIPLSAQVSSQLTETESVGVMHFAETQ